MSWEGWGVVVSSVVGVGGCWLSFLSWRLAGQANAISTRAVEKAESANVIAEQSNIIAEGSGADARRSADASSKSTDIAREAVDYEKERERKSQEARLIFVGVDYENDGPGAGAVRYRAINVGQFPAVDVRQTYGPGLTAVDDRPSQEPFTRLNPGDETSQRVQGEFKTESLRHLELETPWVLGLEYKDGLGTHQAELRVKIALDYASRFDNWVGRSFLDGKPVFIHTVDGSTKVPE